MTLDKPVSVAIALLLAVSEGGDCQASGPERETRLQKLVGRWIITASTFGLPSGASPTFVAQAGADGRSVYSVWSQGSGATRYEATALWAYSSADRQVRVLEANTTGVAETHVGAFDSTSTLRLELRDSRTGAVREERTFKWMGDTLLMSARFVAGNRETEHRVTMIRQHSP